MILITLFILIIAFVLDLLIKISILLEIYFIIRDIISRRSEEVKKMSYLFQKIQEENRVCSK